MNMINTIDVFKQNNLKKTAPRVAIISILASSKKPLLENEIKDKMGAIYNRITFYRSINTLVGSGLIHKIIIDHNCFYAYNGEEITESSLTKNHPHFMCKNCNEIICMKDIKPEKIVLPSGFTIEECNIIIRGLCANCNKAK